MKYPILSMVLAVLAVPAFADERPADEMPAQLVLGMTFGGAHHASFSVNGLDLGEAPMQLAQNDTRGIETEPLDSDEYTIGDEPYDFDPATPPATTTESTTDTTTRTPEGTTSTTTTRTTARSGGGLTPIQWLGIGAAALAVGLVISDSGGGDEQPQVGASGGN